VVGRGSRTIPDFANAADDLLSYSTVMPKSAPSPDSALVPGSARAWSSLATGSAMPNPSEKPGNRSGASPYQLAPLYLLIAKR